MAYRIREDVDLTVRITSRQYAMLAEAAKLHGKSTQALVRNMIKIVGEDACRTQREIDDNEAKEVQS